MTAHLLNVVRHVSQVIYRSILIQIFRSKSILEISHIILFQQNITFLCKVGLSYMLKCV